MRKLSLFVVLCMMVSIFTACSGSGSSGSTPSSSSEAPSSSAASQADASNEEAVTLKLVFQGDAETADLVQVQDAMDALTVPAINARVELTRISHGAFNDQLNLMLSSGEVLDLVNLRQLNTLTLTSNGTIRPLTQLLQDYGKETLDAISQSDWDCCYINGEIMVVPANKDKAYQMCILMDKAICDELGIPYGQSATLDEIHDYLVKVRDAYPNMYPVVTEAGGNLHSYLGNDVLGDNFGVILDIYSDELKVENLFTSDLFKNLCERMWNWAQEGLIMPDGASNTDTANSLMASGKAFARINTRKPGYENERSVQIGKEVVSLSFMEPFTMTDAVSTTYGWAIPYSSENPEKAMELLNMLYTNPELANIMCNGAEGVHWVYTDENKTHIRYPDGKNSSNVGYNRMTYVQPNQQITVPWENDDADIWQQLDEFNRTAHASPAKGFVYDNRAVLNEVTACTNVKNKYWNGLLCGSLDPAVAIPQLNAELEANGIDRIIAEKQRQLDEWAANRK